MKRLIFARHGNTFGPDDSVVWVGAGTDLPLVEKGLAQAHSAAETLRSKHIIPSKIWSAGLLRTRQFASIVAEDLELPAPVIDPRLNEIHYGVWEGASTEEIAATPERAQALEAWQNHDLWPDALGWQGSPQQIAANLRAVFEQMGVFLTGQDETLMVVSSNGILRFVPRVLGIEVTGSYKLKTGALACVEGDGVDWRVLFWG